MRKLPLPLVLAVAAAGGVGMAFAVNALSGPDSFTAKGSEITCISAPDITDGTQVVVTDSDGHVLATSSLQEDDSKTAMAAIKQYDALQLTLGSFGSLADGGGMSAYTFKVDVPAGQARYGVSVGDVNRGTVWFTESQMRKGPQVGLGC